MTKKKVRLQRVTLVVGKTDLKSSGRSQSFLWLHAERILKMPNNGGWQLPTDSKLEIHPEHGLRTKQSKRADKSTD